jgi:ABC-2 type transport system permease protein
MTAVLIGFRLQLAIVRRAPLEGVTLVTTPLLTIVFSSIGANAGQPAFLITAIIGAGLIGLWVLTVNQVGDIVAGDRWNGNLELLVASPASLATLVLGRTCAVVAIGSVAFAESYLTGTLFFGAHLVIHHPVVFALAFLASLVAIAGTACLLTPLFVLTRNTALYQTTLTYPFYILGAVLFPVSILPTWIRPVTHAVFLSWGSQLLRDATQVGPVHDVAGRLLMLLGLGAAAAAIGYGCTAIVVRRVKTTGTVDRG